MRVNGLLKCTEQTMIGLCEGRLLCGVFFCRVIQSFSVMLFLSFRWWQLQQHCKHWSQTFFSWREGATLLIGPDKCNRVRVTNSKRASVRSENGLGCRLAIFSVAASSALCILIIAKIERMNPFRTTRYDRDKLNNWIHPLLFVQLNNCTLCTGA